MKPSLKDRFMAKIAEDRNTGCWNWTAGKDRYGYGAFSKNSKTVGAHRVSIETYYGSIPSGLSVMHKCDNRACVRPDHMMLGTNADNIVDRDSKGRQAKGPTQGLAKLTEADVLAIRAAAGIPKAHLAAKYGVDKSVIRDAINRVTWKHVA